MANDCFSSIVQPKTFPPSIIGATWSLRLPKVRVFIRYSCEFGCDFERRGVVLAMQNRQCSDQSSKRSENLSGIILRRNFRQEYLRKADQSLAEEYGRSSDRPLPSSTSCLASKALPLRE